MPLNPNPRQDHAASIECQGQNQIGLCFDYPKALGHDADDSARQGIHDEIPSDYRPVSAKMTLPVSIAEHHGGGTPRETRRRRRSFEHLVGRQEPSAGRRWNPERLQHPVTHRNVRTCSGSARPVTFAVPGVHTPSA